MAVSIGRDIAHAVAVLQRGGLVAFPTETVYGLGADARNIAYGTADIETGRAEDVLDPDPGPHDRVDPGHAASAPRQGHIDGLGRQLFGERCIGKRLTPVIQRLFDARLGRILVEHAGQVSLALPRDDHFLDLLG